MKKIFKGFKAMLFVLTIMSCNLESEHDLGNGYYLLGSGANTTISKIDKKNSSFYDDVILGEVTYYSFDKKFILIFRTASEKAKIYNGDNPLWEKQKGKDSLQYWIIEKE